MNGWSWVWLLAAVIVATAIVVLGTVPHGIAHTERVKREERERRAAAQRERYRLAFRGVVTAFEELGTALLVTVTAVNDAFARLGQSVQVTAGFPPPKVDRPPLPAGIVSEPPAITRGAHLVMGQPAAVSVAPIGTPPDGDGWTPLGTAIEGVRFSYGDDTYDDETWGLDKRTIWPPREHRAEFTGHDLAALMAAFEDQQREQFRRGWANGPAPFRHPGGRRGTTRGD